MRARIHGLARQRGRVLDALAVRLRLAHEWRGILRRRGRGRTVAIPVVRHRQRVVFVDIFSGDEGGEGEPLVLGVVTRLPAAFIVVVALGDVVDASIAVDAVVAVGEPDGVIELPAGLVELPAGEDVSVVVVVAGMVVTVVVVLEPPAALAPELLYAELGLSQPARAAARAAAATQEMRQFMISPIGSGVSVDALHDMCRPLALAMRVGSHAACIFVPRIVERVLRPRPMEKSPLWNNAESRRVDGPRGQRPT